MNPIIEIKGKFESSQWKGSMSHPDIGAFDSVSISSIEKIELAIDNILRQWQGEDYLANILISVHYNKLVSKSNRIGRLFTGSADINNDVVGAKFSPGIPKHIITYYISKESLLKTLDDLRAVKCMLNNEYNGFVNALNFNIKNEYRRLNYKKYNTLISVFRRIIVDVSHIESIEMSSIDLDNVSNNHIISLYKTEKVAFELLKELGVDVIKSNMLDDLTFLLKSEDVKFLQEKIPYLLAMGVTDISKLDPAEFVVSEDIKIEIHSPSNEPIIGVIDTLFDERVYFNEWVSSNNLIVKDIEPDINRDFNHATQVCSIIVDGHRLNPELDDGCGNFRVRHFGVCLSTGFSSFYIVTKIREILEKNKDIKVWNISLGSNEEINKNFISAEAAELDNIQQKYDCIFVISATNKRDITINRRIGSPADSINGVVVASVDRDGNPSEYSREGIALSFFIKPDLSYYGGTVKNKINAVNSFGKVEVQGSSYAAPWIARKMSYLIDIIGVNKEVAKALLVHSTMDWNKSVNELSALRGYGVVPINIEDIVETSNDEIRFFFSGRTDDYETYNYQFPIPIVDGGYPFVAKATMAYFPRCTRTQGVDYTNSELSIRFGRLSETTIKSINDTTQEITSSNLDYLTEKDARNKVRKWDNVKHISEKYTSRSKVRKAYSSSMWGLSIKSSSRITSKGRDKIRFGVVVTLKEINGVNRINEFIKLFSMKNWLVTKVLVDNKIDLYNKLTDEIEFD